MWRQASSGYIMIWRLWWEWFVEMASFSPEKEQWKWWWLEMCPDILKEVVDSEDIVKHISWWV